MIARGSLSVALAVSWFCPGCSNSGEAEIRRLRSDLTEVKQELERVQADLSQRNLELSALKEEPEGINKAGLLVQSGDLSGSTPTRPPNGYDREIKFPLRYAQPPTVSLAGKWAAGVELNDVKTEGFSVRLTAHGHQQRYSPEQVRSCTWRAKGTPAKE
jgi:hypothetical protein